jgi:hypothetical protein
MTKHIKIRQLNIHLQRFLLDVLFVILLKNYMSLKLLLLFLEVQMDLLLLLGLLALLLQLLLEDLMGQWHQMALKGLWGP